MRCCLSVALWIIAISGCKQSNLRVAVIPRTTALTLWEAAHAGAEFAAGPRSVQVYWNAPTSEDDIKQQAALVDRVIDKRYKGLIIAPDQPLALMAPIRRALNKEVPTVVIASPLPIPPQRNLAYIVNDDDASGYLAATRIGQILNGRGSVAVLGVNPESLSELDILHAFENTLQKRFPDVVIAERRIGTHNGSEAQQITDEVLAAHHELDAIFTLSAVASYGAIAALQSRGLTGQVKLIGFEQSVELGSQVRSHAMDSLIAEDTYQMGYLAMTMLAAHRNGTLPAQMIKLQPTLLTWENIDSPQAQRLMNRDWGHRP